MTEAIRGQVLNIGRSGLFVGLNDDFPSVGDYVKLNIHFEHDGEKIWLNGVGICRWIRTTGNNGAGIEVLDIEVEQIDSFVKVIGKLNCVSSIPRV